MTNRYVVFSACGSQDEAMRLARMLVERHLAACVNVIPSVKSIYRWKEKVEEADETLLMAKTTVANFPKLLDTLRAEHSYDLPEIIALSVADGLPAYLKWMGEA